MKTSHLSLMSLYQAERFAPYSKRMIHGFTGKPLSFGGPDSPTNPRKTVLENRRLLLETLGYPDGSWQIPEQVHGHRLGRTGDQTFGQTDGIVLTEPGHPVMLLFADCVPILLYDPKMHCGAVIHAGWRGTAQKIAQEGVIALQNVTGSQPENIIAAIGPAIGLCCFQVSQTIAEQIGQSIALSVEDLEAKDFLAWDKDFPQNPRLDLKQINHYQLEALGVQQIEILSQCTRCEDEALFSFRRGEAGRNSAFMRLL